MQHNQNNQNNQNKNKFNKFQKNNKQNKEVKEDIKEDIKEEIYFEISDKEQNGSLSKMEITAKKNGWYLLTVGDDGELLNYDYYNAGESLNASGIEGTESFKVSYIPGDPDRPYTDGSKTKYRPLVNYSKEKDWPDWLDPIPLDNNYQEFGIKPAGGKICFKLANNTSELTNKKYMYQFL